MEIKVPKIVVVKKVLLQTLIVVIVYIAVNLLVYDFNSFPPERKIILTVFSACFVALLFFLFMFRKSILSIELNESNVIIGKVNNSNKTLDWSDINAIGFKKIATDTKYIRLPGYLFANSKQNEEFQSFIEKNFYGESTNCLKCNNIIPEGSKVCKSCGWSYEN